MFGTAKPTEVMRLVRTQPSLLSYDTSALEAKVNGLSELMNMTTDETARLVVGRAPGLLTLSLDENLKPSFEVLQELVPGVSASTVVRRAPSLLGYSSNTLRGKLAALQKALPTVDIAKLVSLAPSLLTQSVQHNTYRKIRALQQLFAPNPTSQSAAQRQAKVGFLLTLPFPIPRPRSPLFYLPTFPVSPLSLAHALPFPSIP